MPRNPPEPGWYELEGRRRYWSGQVWHLAGQFVLDPGGDLPSWTIDEADDLVDESLVTTMSELPGYWVVASHGVVTELTATSGWTATWKGNTALSSAMRSLRTTARQDHGANAIVGVVASTFAAGGGITNMLGGDAVGVLLTGTAVTVEQRSAEGEAGSDAARS